MKLRYAVKQFIKYRRQRKAMQDAEEYYRDEILRQCLTSCIVAGLRVSWYFQKGQVSPSRLEDAGINPDFYRGQGSWCARLTEEEGVDGRQRAPRKGKS